MSMEAEVQQFVSTVRTVKGQDKQEQVNESAADLTPGRALR